MSRLAIVFYHNVSPSWWYPSEPGAARAGFAAQMRALARLGTPVDLPDAVARLHGGGRLPARAFAVTFDDGYRDNLHDAADVLHGLGVPATFFLVPAVLDGWVPWWERLGWAVQRATRPLREVAGRPLPDDGTARDAAAAVLKALPSVEREEALADLEHRLEPSGDVHDGVAFLDWDDAAALVERGFTVGSHSERHAVLAREDDASVEAQLTASRAVLGRRLGVDVDVLAYPHGGPDDYDARTVAAAERAGYRAACTTVPGLNSPATSRFELRRIDVAATRGRLGLLGAVRRVARARGRGGHDAPGPV